MKVLQVILIMFMGGSNSPIIQIPGFTSLEACEAEMKRQEEYRDFGNYVEYRCVVVR